MRYSGPFALEQRTAHERLPQVCFCDNGRDIALVAERGRGAGGPQLIGVGRLTKTHLEEQAELALVVEDDWQNVGVGTAVIESLLEIARNAGVRRITGRIAADNSAMRHLAAREGFSTTFEGKAGMWRLELDLDAAAVL
jgi:acetyltransferase